MTGPGGLLAIVAMLGMALGFGLNAWLGFPWGPLVALPLGMAFGWTLPKALIWHIRWLARRDAKRDRR